MEGAAVRDCEVYKEVVPLLMTIEQLFFEFLQVAIGNRKELSHIPSAEEWKELFELSNKQALTAIAFAGVTRLNPGSDFGANIGIPEVVYLKWLGLTAKVAQRNKEMTAACAELCKELAHDGLASCILKGQGNLEYYPEKLQEYRTSGDIDVWCEPLNPSGLDIAVSDWDGKGAHYERYQGIEAVIEYSLMKARLSGLSTPEVRYNHTDLHGIWNVDVEIHHTPTLSYSFLRNHRLQHWLKVNKQFEVHSFNGFSVPSVSFNAIFQLCHIYSHLLNEGIGLRQLLDYYFVLRALHIEQKEFSDRTQSMVQWAEAMGIAVKSNAEIMHTLGRFGMAKFASATMWVLKAVFAMPDVYLLCPPNEKEGKFLLNEIMLAGNFGKYDKRIKHGGGQVSHVIEKTKHNIRLLTHYPEEVLWEPWFRVYHWVWRKCRLWRW